MYISGFSVFLVKKRCSIATVAIYEKKIKNKTLFMMRNHKLRSIKSKPSNAYLERDSPLAYLSLKVFKQIVPCFSLSVTCTVHIVSKQKPKTIIPDTDMRMVPGYRIHGFSPSTKNIKNNPRVSVTVIQYSGVPCSNCIE
jgi:hypothetical protein